MLYYNTMLSQREGLIALVITLVLVLVAIASVNTYQCGNHLHNHLTGLWIADEKFCNDADIDGMLLYIGECEGRKHNAYLIMYSDNAVILEKKFSFKVGRVIPSIVIIYPTTMSRLVTLKDPEVTDGNEDIPDESVIPLTDIMPLDLQMELDLAHGCLTWSSGDITYLKAYKDNYASS
jgi:hypothetical protein